MCWRARDEVVYRCGNRFGTTSSRPRPSLPCYAGTKTEIGRCAAYAFATTQQNPKTGARSNYKSPFVYDMADKQCYVLALGAQLLKGEKYCSVGGSPPGLTWSCFEPTRDLARGMRFVYGSAHIGEFDPDSWEDRCRKHLFVSELRLIPVSVVA